MKKKILKIPNQYCSASSSSLHAATNSRHLRRHPRPATTAAGAPPSSSSSSSSSATSTETVVRDQPQPRPSFPVLQFPPPSTIQPRHLRRAHIAVKQRRHHRCLQPSPSSSTSKTSNTVPPLFFLCLRLHRPFVAADTSEGDSDDQIPFPLSSHSRATEPSPTPTPIHRRHLPSP